MKVVKVIFVLLIIAAAVLAALYFLDKYKNNESGEGIAAVTAIQETAAESGAAETPSGEEYSETGGGNADNSAKLDITVSEDRYLYDNRELSYDELIEILDGLDKNASVSLHDEYATMKAYQNLTAALDERGIPYSEEKND